MNRRDSEILLENLQKKSNDDLITNNEDPLSLFELGDKKETLDLVLSKHYPDMSAEERKHFINFSNEKIKELFEIMPSRYEDPLTFPHLNRLSRLAHDQSQHIDKKEFPLPTIGTIPGYGLNATVIEASKDDYLIALDRGLLRLLAHLSNLIAGLLTYKNDSVSTNYDLILEKILDEDIQNTFSDIFLRFIDTVQIFKGESQEIEGIYCSFIDRQVPEIPKGTGARFGQLLLEGAELFLISHEYGHISREHFI